MLVKRKRTVMCVLIDSRGEFRLTNTLSIRTNVSINFNGSLKKLGLSLQIRLIESSLEATQVV